MAENRDYITVPEENEKGTINISEEVITAIAAAAALETEGVASLSGSFGKKTSGKGVRVTGDENGVVLDVYVLTVLTAAVGKVGAEVQAAVKAAVESSTGIPVRSVNVQISGVSIEKK